MADGIYNAVSGAVASARRLDVVANNLANASTAGFKQSRMAFSEVLAANTEPNEIATDTFVRTDATAIDFSAGPLRQTGNALDIALEGPGFLAVKDGARTLYGRGGALRLDGGGQLVTAAGMQVLNSNDQPITVSMTDGQVSIAADGTVSAGKSQFGKIKLVEFDKPALLERVGTTLFASSASAGLKNAEKTRVQSGFVESSNVNMVRGVVTMIEASRAYEAFNRVISTFTQVDRRAVTRIAQQ